MSVRKCWSGGPIRCSASLSSEVRRLRIGGKEENQEVALLLHMLLTMVMLR